MACLGAVDAERGVDHAEVRASAVWKVSGFDRAWGYCKCSVPLGTILSTCLDHDI